MKKRILAKNRPGERKRYYLQFRRFGFWCYYRDEGRPVCFTSRREAAAQLHSY